MTPLVTLSGPAASFLIDNVNTDMIAPMYRPAQAGAPRGLTLKREDLAGMLFAGLRYDTQDREIPDFMLNRPQFRNACFLFGGAKLRVRIIARYRCVDVVGLRHTLRARSEFWRNLSRQLL